MHKTANALDKMPKAVQQRAKTLIQDIYLAETKEQAEAAIEHCCDSYQDKHPKAVECLEPDREALMAFYDFPAVHWVHIRSTNVIESVLATIRLRTHKAKGLLAQVDHSAAGYPERTAGMQVIWEAREG